MKCFLFFLCVPFYLSCADLKQKQKDEYEMRKNFNNFIFSVDELDSDGLNVSAVFPGVEDYREHVKTLLVGYIDSIKDGKIEFDEVGVVLTRFLGLSYHHYVIKKMDIDRAAGTAKLRISVHFGYENNLKATQNEKGTKFFIPTKPWGSANIIIIGEKNMVPRVDLEFIEFDVEMVASEYEGYWRVKKTTVDEASMKFRESDESFDE